MLLNGDSPVRRNNNDVPSFLQDPRGNFLAQANEDEDALVVAEMDLGIIDEVRKTWQFYRDRRPETYGELVEL